VGASVGVSFSFGDFLLDKQKESHSPMPRSGGRNLFLPKEVGLAHWVEKCKYFKL
jgi:hypothetical protein